MTFENMNERVKAPCGRDYRGPLARYSYRPPFYHFLPLFARASANLETAAINAHIIMH